MFFRCVSVCPLTGPHMIITHDAFHLMVQSLPGHISTSPRPDMGHKDPGPTSDIWWPSLENCSEVFIGPHCTGPRSQYWNLVATESHTVGKQVVHILLEFFLVYNTVTTSRLVRLRKELL